MAIQTQRKMPLTLGKSSSQEKVFPWIYSWRIRELLQDLSKAVENLPGRRFERGPSIQLQLRKLLLLVVSLAAGRQEQS